MYFERAQDQHEEWLSARKVTVAEQLELHQPEDQDRRAGWNACFGYQPINRTLRIMIAHRTHNISSAILDLTDVQRFIEAIKKEALEFGDEEAAARITQVTDAALPQLIARSEAYKAGLYAYSPRQLMMMSEEAMAKYSRWNPTYEDTKNVVAQRYWDACFAFRKLAKFLDSPEYKKELSWVQRVARKARDSWEAIFMQSPHSLRRDGVTLPS